MTRFQPYSRREFQRSLILWARRNVRVLLIITGGMVTLIASATVLIAVFLPTTVFTWWFLGIIQAAMVAMYLHLMHASFLAHNGDAIWHLRGAWGEDNTRSELQRAKRKQLIWGWVDSINLQAGDLDHLVVTRNGGLVAVDSKWRNRASDTIDMARAASKAQVARGGADSIPLETGQRTHRAKVDSLRVKSIVVLWGAAQHDVPDGATVDGIDFTTGQRLLAWLTDLEGDPVTKAAAADVVDRLEHFRAATWDGTRTASRESLSTSRKASVRR